MKHNGLYIPKHLVAHSAFAGLFLFFCYISCNSKAAEVYKGTIKAGGFQIYYERQGKGDAVLFLHAGLQDHTMWAAQVAAFAKQYDVITIDLPFHGQTTGADTTTLAQDVVKIVLDSLHIQKAAVAGLSMGASVAQDFIIAYPGRVTKAFLISAGVNGYDKKFPIDSASMNWWYRFSNALKEKDTARAAREFTKAWAEGIYRSGDSLAKPVSKYVYATTLANLQRHKMEAWPRLADAPPAMERLSTIKVPVLVVYGDKDLPYVITASRYMEKNIPGARRMVIKDAAHMLNMEKPEELNRMMMEFLAGR